MSSESYPVVSGASSPPFQRGCSNNPVAVSQSSSALLNGPGNAGQNRPAPNPGKNSPNLSSSFSSSGKSSSGQNSEKVKLFGRNSPIPSLKNVFRFKASPSPSPSPSPSRKDASLVSETSSQTNSNSRSNSPFPEGKNPLQQIWSVSPRFSEPSPNLEKRKTSSRNSKLSRRESVVVSPSYSYLSDRLRRVSVGSLQCSLFCGGQNCKYEGGSHWGAEDMAVKGLYSHWVTDYILAMARPSTKLLQKESVIQEFQRHGIGSVINLQQPGEHAQCGDGLEVSSGFTYRPEDLMNNGMYFYNYGWADYGVPTLQSVLGMVKVMDFALSEGKVAVHCHAGLGRTGVLIACYLIYSRRLSGNRAITHVRKKRPGSIQTRPQVELVRDFAHFLNPLWTFFPSPLCPLSLQELLHNQLLLLHGDLDQQLKYIPKVIHDLCVQLTDCCNSDSNDSVFSGALTDKSASLAGDEVAPSIQLTACSSTAIMTEKEEEEELEGVAESLASWCEEVELSRDMAQKMEDIEVEVNGSLNWVLLRSETSILCLLHLCSRFLATLKAPVVEEDDDLSWLLLDHTKSWKTNCTPSQMLLEQVARTFNTLLEHVCKKNADNTDSIDRCKSPSLLMRGVAKRLAADLCQDPLNCSSCESALFRYWRLSSLSATDL